ncbi:MAG: hypothetical protein HOF30_09740 [Rhodospirillaceae bacterium]|nr:hypothetical protein [Rhodospirillaceae bacterium]
MTTMKIRNIESFKKLRKTWNFCKGMGITEVVDVPIRKKGMTGSGLSGQCHSNVRLLTKTYGGRKVMGFSATPNGSALSVPHRIPVCDKSIFFLHHSVWETPEGEMVDVSFNYLRYDSIVFLPLIKYDPRVEEYLPPGDVCFTPNDGIWLFGNLCFANHGIDTRCVSNRHIKRNSTTMRNALLPRDGVWCDENEEGGFTKPSTATGKPFELRDAA